MLLSKPNSRQLLAKATVESGNTLDVLPMQQQAHSNNGN